MRTRSGMLGLYMFLVFASGAVVGAFGHRLYSAKSVAAKAPAPKKEDFRQKYLRQMKTRLKLDDGQMAKLEVMFDQYGARYREVKERMDPEMKQIQTEQRNEVKAMLDEAQKIEYQKMIEERDRKAKDEKR
jgi:hypothetical protein